jgi:hypothetical protein
MDTFYIVGLLEPIVVIGSMLGLAFGVKLLVWGKGPLRQIRRGGSPALEQRVAELEGRSEHSSELLLEQGELLEDLVERLDFAERMLTQQRADEPLALERPEESTPV